MISQRSIHSHSLLPSVYKCRDCSHLISDVSTRGIKKELCNDCSSGKTEQKAIRFASDIFKRWNKTTPIYKFNLLHQTALKYAVLSNDLPCKTKDERRNSVRSYHHSSKARNYFMEYDRIVRLRHFAKFWDMIEV